jgi:hypothetical protein
MFGRIAEWMSGACVCVLTGVSLSTSAAAQQTIAFSELVGHSIETTFVYDRTLRREGVIRHNRQTQVMRLSFVPNERIDQSLTVTVFGERGRIRGPVVLTSHHVLDKPHQGRTGHILWTFNDATLTRLQTFEEGGRRISIRLSRSGGGLKCVVDAPFAKEEGRGGIRTDSLFGGGKVEFLSVKQVSNDCQFR